jgi:predicted Rossmann-fold nucleotide-binding protein
MRVIVCGGRHYTDREKVFEELDALAEKHGWLTIIEGGAPGADYLGKCWAQERYHGSVTFVADWRKNPVSAGPIRNEKMMREGKPDLVLAFPGQKGTADCLRQAKKYGVKIKEIE